MLRTRTLPLPFNTRRGSRMLLGYLALNRSPCPVSQLLLVFNDLNGHLVVALECLLAVGLERGHAAPLILGPRHGIGLEIQPSVGDDPKEDPAVIQPIATEHPSAIDMP